MAKAYSYVRFSTPEQRQGSSLARQVEAAKAYALEHGLELDDTLRLTDLGVSAYRGDNVKRGALGKFLEAAQSGEVEAGSYLLVESLDRVSRRTAWRALGVLSDIIGLGIIVVTLQDRREYSEDILDADSNALLYSIMVMARAHEESETKSRRVTDARNRARAEARSSGKPLTSRCPAWLRPKKDLKGFEVIPERAEVVQRIFRMSSEGNGQHSIAQSLNRDGVPTFGDGPRQTKAQFWHRSYIVKVLRNPAVAGVYIPRRIAVVDGVRKRVSEAPIPGYYPAVISDEGFQAAQARNATRAAAAPRGRHAAGGAKYLLSGLARCGRCGSSMTRVYKGSRRKAGLPKLVCTKAKAGAGCQYEGINLPYVDTYVMRAFCDAQRYAPAGDTATSDDRALQAMAEEEVRLSGNIRALLFDAEIVDGNQGLRDELAAMATRRDELKREITTLRASIEANRPAHVRKRLTALETALREVWKARGLAVGEKVAPGDEGDQSAAFELYSGALRAANTRLREVVSAIIVHPDTLTFSAEWRHGGVSPLEQSSDQWVNSLSAGGAARQTASDKTSAYS